MVAGWPDLLADDPTDWLLDEDNPSVRYHALRSLMELPEDHRQVVAAKRAVMESGPVPIILDAQSEEGYWVKPGSGYSPKYQGTVWQIIFLGHLAPDERDERVARGCEYVLSHSVAKNGGFAPTATPIPSATIECLNGNLIHAFYRLGWGNDERVQSALHQLTSRIAEKHFECAANAKLPCAWGAVKALLAFSAIPMEERSNEVKAAIEEGAAFLLSRDLAVADYPCWERPSSVWQKFGFPLGYTSNVLEALYVLSELGYGARRPLHNALRLLLSKQDVQGRWKMETSLNGKMWVDIERKGKPSKWVTLKALQTLKRVFGGN
jgi:hypothetical protein